MDTSIKNTTEEELGIKGIDIFASNEELYKKLTAKEFSLVKLVKVEEFLEDLYGHTLYPEVNDMFPPKDSYLKIKILLKELRKLNREKTQG
jgi:hypothetical protein